MIDAVHALTKCRRPDTSPMGDSVTERTLRRGTPLKVFDRLSFVMDRAVIPDGDGRNHLFALTGVRRREGD
jgi:hypothetical protein